MATLKDLVEWHQNGILSNEEFQAAKQTLLFGRSGSAPPTSSTAQVASVQQQTLTTTNASQQSSQPSWSQHITSARRDEMVVNDERRLEASEESMTFHGSHERTVRSSADDTSVGFGAGKGVVNFGVTTSSTSHEDRTSHTVQATILRRGVDPNLLPRLSASQERLLALLPPQDRAKALIEMSSHTAETMERFALAPSAAGELAGLGQSMALPGGSVVTTTRVQLQNTRGSAPNLEPCTGQTSVSKVKPKVSMSL